MINLKRLDPVKAYVVLYTYYWVEGPGKFTAHFVRLATSQMFNHGAALLYINGIWWVYESNELGTVRRPAAEVLERKGATYRIMEYTGPVATESVVANANLLLGRKYDHPNLLLQQLPYRICKKWCSRINNLVGYELLQPWWFGKKGEAATEKLQCFEFLFNIFELLYAYLASGQEFSRIPYFKEIT